MIIWMVRMFAVDGRDFLTISCFDSKEKAKLFLFKNGFKEMFGGDYSNVFDTIRAEVKALKANEEIYIVNSTSGDPRTITHNMIENDRSLSEEWKSVSERPPKVNTYYLVYSRLNWAHGGNKETAKELYEHMKVAYYDPTGHFNVPEVIYWREMPIPPGGKVVPE